MTHKNAVLYFYCLILSVPFAWSGADSRFDILLERAQQFEKTGLYAIAQEQYAYLLNHYPEQKVDKGAFKRLSERQIDVRMKNAELAHTVGAYQLALNELATVQRVDPKFGPAVQLRKKIEREMKAKKGLMHLVEHDYVKGVEFYQAGRLEKSLEHFVKVVNVMPDHSGALTYIEKIGQRLNVTQ